MVRAKGRRSCVDHFDCHVLFLIIAHGKANPPPKKKKKKIITVLLGMLQ